MHGSGAWAYAAHEVASATTRAAAAMTPERLRGTVGKWSGVRVPTGSPEGRPIRMQGCTAVLSPKHKLNEPSEEDS